jgi:hypothetical protein
MPSIADYVRQFCRQEETDAPIQWVWAVHDGKRGVLWTLVHDDGRVLEQRHYPNIATAGAARGPEPARLVGQAPPEEMRRFAATLLAQGFDWIQIPMLPDAVLQATASQQVELTVTAGEARSHLRFPGAALERTPRLREIARAFERVIEQAAQHPPPATEAMTDSPLRAAVQQWRAKEISGTVLMRRLVGYESWFVPIPEAAAEEVSTEGAPSRVMVSRDAEGKRRLLLYSDPAACAQFRWVSASAAEGAAEKQHYLTAEGIWVFRLPLGKVDELVIDPGMDHEIVYGREQFERLRQMADALELEAALVQLRADAERLEELMPLLWTYPHYTVAIHNKADRPPQLAVARDEESRTLAAVFTFDDCFDAFQAADAMGRYSDELVEQTAIPAPELFEQLAGMDAAGVVFNCAGPAAPVVFSLELARFIWETNRPAAPPSVEGEGDGASRSESGVEGLVFDGDAYRLQYAAGDETMIANEFLPEDQTSENWSRMLAVRLFFQEHDPVEYARSLETRLKEANPEAYSRLESAADGEEAVIDFLTWAEDDPAESAEFNIFRLIRHPRGLLAYQFAFRPAMAGVSREDVLHQGGHLVELMKKAAFPEPMESP